MSQITRPDWLTVVTDYLADNRLQLHIRVSREQSGNSETRQGKITVVLDDERESTLNIPVLLFVEE